MHPRLGEGVRLGTFQDNGEKQYYALDDINREYELSASVYRELKEADGTRPLRLGDDVIRKLKAYDLITTTRWEGFWLIHRLIILPIGRRAEKIRPVCCVINKVLPVAAVLLFAVGVLAKRLMDTGISSFYSIPLAYLLFFGSIAAHEYGHLVACVAYRYKVYDTGLLFIGILPMGAYVSYKRDDKRPRQQKLQVALAGVETNLLLAGVFLILSVSIYPLSAVFIMLANLNVLLTILNIIPAFMLDGEKALSALLGIKSISRASKGLFDRQMRRKAMELGAAGYVSLALFAIINAAKAFVVLYITYEIFSLLRLGLQLVMRIF